MLRQSNIVEFGKRLRPAVNNVIQKSLPLPDRPILDDDEVPWTATLRANWRTIRDEALAVLEKPETVPKLLEIAPAHDGLIEPQDWQSFFLHGYGHPIPENLARCPKTADILKFVPGLNTAFFSILAPGAHILDHEGVTKGLITCHLGLVIPATGDCRMRVDDQIVRWKPGETLVFDDTFNHEVWNDSDETRVVLLIQAKRELRQPGKAVASAFLWAVKQSPFVRDGIGNLSSWNKAMRRVEDGFAPRKRA